MTKGRGIFAHLLGCALLLPLISSPAQSAIIFSGDFTAGTGQIQSTEALSFNITGSGNTSNLVFDEIVNSDGGFNIDGTLTGNIGYQLGTSTGALTGVKFIDNFSFTNNEFTPNDADFSFDPLSVTSGQTLTLDPFTLSNIGGAGFNPLLNSVSNFTGNLFLTANSGIRLSDNATVSAVPVPAAAWLLGTGLLAMLGMDRGRCGQQAALAAA